MISEKAIGYVSEGFENGVTVQRVSFHERVSFHADTGLASITGCGFSIVGTKEKMKSFGLVCSTKFYQRFLISEVFPDRC